MIMLLTSVKLSVKLDLTYKISDKEITVSVKTCA
jgi:hypothetical protein